MKFSEPNDPAGYADTPITDDLISDIYQAYVETTRMTESTSYMRTLSGIVLGLDTTFRSASKATVTDSERGRHKLLKGGLVTIINEHNEILHWVSLPLSHCECTLTVLQRFCHTEATDVFTNMLTDVRLRCEALGLEFPEMAVVDNCCKFRSSIVKAFPDIKVVLDVWHFLMRCVDCVLPKRRTC